MSVSALMEPARQSTYAAPARFDLRDVTFSIDNRSLLHPLTLDVPPHRLVALIGHNGSGKSTLLKLLARQMPPSGGCVRFANKDLGNWGERAFARKVAYLPQQLPVAAGMLAKELVALGRYPWHGAFGRFSEIDRNKVIEAMEQTDVTALAGRQVDSLSGGERQRVWLAMLLAQDTECLLLDEPTSALDIAHQVEILTLIHRLSQERGLGVIAVLHDINMAARFCDEIIALHGGRLIARGAPKDLMREDELKAIYGLPMGVMPHPDSGKPISYVR